MPHLLVNYFWTSARSLVLVTFWWLGVVILLSDSGGEVLGAKALSAFGFGWLLLLVGMIAVRGVAHFAICWIEKQHSRSQ